MFPSANFLSPPGYKLSIKSRPLLYSFYLPSPPNPPKRLVSQSTYCLPTGSAGTTDRPRLVFVLPEYAFWHTQSREPNSPVMPCVEWHTGNTKELCFFFFSCLVERLFCGKEVLSNLSLFTFQHLLKGQAIAGYLLPLSESKHALGITGLKRFGQASQ